MSGDLSFHLCRRELGGFDIILSGGLKQTREAASHRLRASLRDRGFAASTYVRVRRHEADEAVVLVPMAEDQDRAALEIASRGVLAAIVGVGNRGAA